MGSATSSIPAEPVVAVAALVGALGYSYVHYVRPTAQSDDDVDGNATGGVVASTLHGQKKRGRKLQLPGDATLKNLDILDGPGGTPKRPISASVREPGPISATRQRQRQQQQPLQPQQRQQHPADRSQDIVPGGFSSAVGSSEEVRDAQPQQGQEPPAKKQKKKKGGKKSAVLASSNLSSASASTSVAATSQLASGSTEGTAWIDVPSATVAKAKKGLASESVDDTHGQIERWTRVEARRKKAVPPHTTATDATTSDAGITTSVTDNSSVVTERTTEDELPPGLDESVLEMSTSSLPDVPPRVVPVRPPPGEQPAKGFTWDDYEGVQDDEDASGEDDGGWGVVKSRKRPNKTASEEATTSDPQPLTKKQRQNAQRREALKEVKREREAQQQAALASHKRELERARVAEKSTTSKRTGSRFDSLG